MKMLYGLTEFPFFSPIKQVKMSNFSFDISFKRAIYQVKHRGCSSDWVCVFLGLVCKPNSERGTHAERFFASLSGELLNPDSALPAGSIANRTVRPFGIRCICIFKDPY